MPLIRPSVVTKEMDCRLCELLRSKEDILLQSHLKKPSTWKDCTQNNKHEVIVHRGEPRGLRREPEVQVFCRGTARAAGWTIITTDMDFPRGCGRDDLACGSLAPWLWVPLGKSSPSLETLWVRLLRPGFHEPWLRFPHLQPTC